MWKMTKNYYNNGTLSVAHSECEIIKYYAHVTGALTAIPGYYVYPLKRQF